MSNKDHIKKLSYNFSEMNKVFNARAIKILNTETLESFNSIREASRYYNIDSSYLSKHLKGFYENVKGMRFAFNT
jgi:hypothetical protein